MKSNRNLHTHPGLALLDTRRAFTSPYPTGRLQKAADEGGCGVTGFAASVPVAGRHIVSPSVQMHNRGNGKGGGIAAVGLDAATLGVSQEILDDDYLIQVAYLDTEARAKVESQFITPVFRVDHARRQPTVD
ncbi:MAG: glutamate synthase, partial [Desulfobaccales bacterium]